LTVDGVFDSQQTWASEKPVDHDLRASRGPGNLPHAGVLSCATSNKVGEQNRQHRLTLFEDTSQRQASALFADGMRDAVTGDQSSC
jgi:hypothetical protein